MREILVGFHERPVSYIYHPVVSGAPSLVYISIANYLPVPLPGMVHKIRVSRDRVSTAQYVLKKTKGGYRGHVKKNKKPANNLPSTSHSGKTVPGKRPRLETYVSPPDDTFDAEAIPVPFDVSPSVNAIDLPQSSEEYREELMVPHSGKSSKGKVKFSIPFGRVQLTLHLSPPFLSSRHPMSTWKSGRGPDLSLI